jgi:cell wall-associated NlpC family hydrolase
MSILRMKLRIALLILVVFVLATDGYARSSDQQSFGDKIKQLFTGPSPTPRKKHKNAKKKTSPSPDPSASVSPTPSPSPSAAVTETPLPVLSPTPTESPSASPIQTATPPPTTTASPAQWPRSRPHAPLIEPVRPINPGPHSRRKIETPPPGVTIPNATIARPRPIEVISPPTSTSTVSPIATVPPTAKPQPTATPTPSIAPNATRKPSASPTATPAIKRKPTAPANISPSEIVGYESYSPTARKIVDLSVSLTNQNLDYKYSSADPKNGGMDSSGFIHYVLEQTGLKDPPRDAREQYVWVRKAGNFQAVLAHRDDSFELDALKPGDLLFWSSTYFVDRDPSITQTMIYLGREKRTNQRIMVGASEHQTYKGQPKIGVSILDFKIAVPKSKPDGASTPVFVGYGHIPGLPNE